MEAFLTTAFAAALELLESRASEQGFLELLEQVYGATSSDDAAFAAAAGSLQQLLSSGSELGIQVKSLDGADMNGAMGAYSSTGVDGQPVIYINTSLLSEGADPELLQRVLLEEIGHHFDILLNGSVDTAGDEGELFADLISGDTLTLDQLSAITTQNDAGTVLVDGQTLAVEQAVTGTGSSITTTSATTLNKASGTFNYTIAVDNTNNHGADLLVAAYTSSGALIGWQVVNRAGNLRSASYSGTFDLNAANLNSVDTTSITIRAWQGTAGSNYGTASDTAPAVTYGTGNLTAGATTGFVPNSTSAPVSASAGPPVVTATGSIAFTGTITTGSWLSSTSAFGVDTIAPTVTDANISISGGSGTSGAYKIGDTVTAVYDPGSQGSELSSVTVDFSQFGGGTAVAASLAASGPNAGKYVSTYTIVSGSIDTTSRNVSVTVTDNAGNTTTATDTSNATVDNIAPTVNDANISISGGSGTSGAYKIGDTVTAVYDPGSQGSELSSVTVDFSQFGGGTAVAASLAASGPNAGKYVATYTIVSGSIDTTSRNVSVTATDNAGNTTTATDTSNATVDNIAPKTPSFLLATDSGTSGDGITNVGTVNVTGVEPGATWQYSTDSGTSWSEAQPASTTTFTLSPGTYSLSSISLRQTDAAGNTSNSGSQGAADGSITVDTTPPSASLTAATIPNTGSVSVQSSETGTAYLVNSSVSVTDLASITGAPDNLVNSVTISAANTNTSLSAAGLADGTYKLYTVDDAGNLSLASSDSVTVDTSAPGAPSFSLATDSGTSGTDGITNVGTVNVTGVESNATWEYTTNGNASTPTWFTGSGTSFTLPAGTYASGAIRVRQTDLAGNTTTTPSQNAAAITVDVTNPTLTISADQAALKAGESTTLHFNFSEDVGTSFLASDVSVESGTISNFTGTGTHYTATYTPATGTTDGLMGVSVAASNYTDLAGNAPASGSTFNLEVDTQAPTVTGISYGLNDSTATVNEAVTFVVSFSEIVTVTGTPTLTLSNGATATYSSGSGTDQVVFSYTPAGGQASSSDIGVSSLNLNGSTITDAAGNSANTSGANNLNPDGTLAINTTAAADGTAPTATAVQILGTGTDKTLNAGDYVIVKVTTSEAVTVTGTPTFVLDVGGFSRPASYVSGSGTSTLTFSYQIQPGEQDSSGGVTSGEYALHLNDGSISDTSGNVIASTSNAVAVPAVITNDLVVNGGSTASLSFTFANFYSLYDNGQRNQVQHKAKELLDTGINITATSGVFARGDVILINGTNYHVQGYALSRNGNTLDLVLSSLPLGTGPGEEDATSKVDGQFDQYFLLTGNTYSANPQTGSPINNLRFADSPDVSYLATTTTVTTAAAPVCFVAGTLIRTPQGERPIEQLQPGDLVLTPEGPVPVKFLARTRRHVSALRCLGRMPIQVQAGALGAQGPERTTCMSPSHAILIDGHLVEAGALLNGSTINQLQEWPETWLSYYNIELEAHGLIWANGMQAESYFSNFRSSGFSRESWDNFAEYIALYGEGELMQELPLPRIPFARQLPSSVRRLVGLPAANAAAHGAPSDSTEAAPLLLSLTL